MTFRKKSMICKWRRIIGELREKLKDAETTCPQMCSKEIQTNNQPASNNKGSQCQDFHDLPVRTGNAENALSGHKQKLCQRSAETELFTPGKGSVSEFCERIKGLRRQHQHIETPVGYFW